MQPLAIDYGANIGLSSVWYARQFPEAKIIAMEPDQSNLEIASMNLAAYPNVTLVRGGVWDMPSHLSIVNPDAEHGPSKLKKAKVNTRKEYLLL